MHKVINKIKLYKEQKEVVCNAGNTILEATLAAGVNHMHACGGKGKCSTCRVGIIEGEEYCQPRTKKEKVIAEKLKLPDQIRLACQTKLSGNIFIRRMISDEMDMKIIQEQFVDKSGAALGTEQELTIVFSDIVNYTPFAEQFPSYDTVHVLNRYYKTMNEVIIQHGGFISDVAGDSILAVFGNEGGSDNSVIDALSAVNKMIDSLEGFNTYLKENYHNSFDIRVGIHYGAVILGPFDTGSMKKLAVIGDSVNMASRIETANKELGTRILLSEEAYDKVQDQFPNNQSFTTGLKGKSGSYKLFRIVD